MPDALIYRVRPSWLVEVVGGGGEGPLYMPDLPNNREGPQAREPSECLNRRRYRERLAKEAF